MYITAQGCRLRNDLYCVEWDVKLYYTIYLTLLRHRVTVSARVAAGHLLWLARRSVELSPGQSPGSRCYCSQLQALVEKVFVFSVPM